MTIAPTFPKNKFHIYWNVLRVQAFVSSPPLPFCPSAWPNNCLFVTTCLREIVKVSLNCASISHRGSVGFWRCFSIFTFAAGRIFYISRTIIIRKVKRHFCDCKCHIYIVCHIRMCALDFINCKLYALNRHVENITFSVASLMQFCCKNICRYIIQNMCVCLITATSCSWLLYTRLNLICINVSSFVERKLNVILRFSILFDALSHST